MTGTRRQAGKAAAAESTAWWSSAGVDRGVRPVSYTHLRAHETVLDLVCRLLLEKKKQHDTQHPITENADRAH